MFSICLSDYEGRWVCTVTLRKGRSHHAESLLYRPTAPWKNFNDFSISDYLDPNFGSVDCSLNRDGSYIGNLSRKDKVEGKKNQQWMQSDRTSFKRIWKFTWFRQQWTKYCSDSAKQSTVQTVLNKVLFRQC